MQDPRVPFGRRCFLRGAAMTVAATAIARAGGVDAGQALRKAVATRRRAHLAEHACGREAVDLYYEAAVGAYAAMAADPAGPAKALATYNESLAGLLRSASRHGAIDPRSHLVVRSPRGDATVPIVHQGFAWSPSDFNRLIDPGTAPRNPSNVRDHSRRGLGAPQVVVRPNPRATVSDEFLADPMFFPATAVLRPDLGAWLGGGGAGAGDVLEFYDPIRVGSVAGPGGAATLAADLDAPVAFLEEDGGGLKTGWSGLLNPSQDVNRAFLGLIEPFQPGKIPIVFVHGLYDTPYTFSDLMNGLRRKPGFLDRYQIAGYRYATGLTFLHSAALCRRDLNRFSAAVDPAGADPGVQNAVLIGHSMGGLMSKFQVVSSGDAFWDLVCDRPLASIAATDQVRSTLSTLFYFDPPPMIRRAIFLAAPHEGLSKVAQPGGVLSERLTRPPEDLRGLVAQVDRDNPGAFKPYLRDLPNSIGMLRRREPLLATLRCRPVDPAISVHTLAGTARVPAGIAHGDGVVPISSAHLDGAESETLVPEFHTTINSSEYTFVEIVRILRLHAGG